MNIQKRIEEEAYSNTNKREAEIIKTGYKYVLKPELDYAFEQGAHFGFQLCIEMLKERDTPQAKRYAELLMEKMKDNGE